MPARALIVAIALALAALTGSPRAQSIGGLQGPINVTGGVGSSGTPYAGPGDVFSGAFTWYSCQFAYSQAVAAAHTQATCNLSRASDSHTCDIIIGTNGSWNQTANCSTGGDNGQSAAAFCNATTCSVTKAYDQSGANNCSSAPCNLTQATAAEQPTIAFNSPSAGLATLAFLTTSTQFLGNSVISLGSVVTFSMMTKSINNSTQQAAISTNSGAPQFSYNLSGTNANTAFVFEQTSGQVTASDGSFHDLQGLLNAGGSAINVDGTDTTGLAVGTFSASQLQWGSDTASGGHTLNGNSGEAGVWSATTTATNRNALCHNQSVRWGVASC